MFEFPDTTGNMIWIDTGCFFGMAPVARAQAPMVSHTQGVKVMHDEVMINRHDELAFHVAIE
jgi:hypothetical protein